MILKNGNKRKLIRENGFLIKDYLETKGKRKRDTSDEGENFRTEKTSCYSPKRELIFDTETTGLSSEDKIVEISLIETIEGIKTGRSFHCFLNPEVKISKKAVKIHRLTNEKLSNYPTFKQISKKLIDFIGDSTLVAHNANFDMKMLNNEFRRIELPCYGGERFIDTLRMARFLFPGQKNRQDDLCERFGIDNSVRVGTGIHSAKEDTVHLYFIFKKMGEMLRDKNKDVYNFLVKN